jgi:hypothetical protein
MILLATEKQLNNMTLTSSRKKTILSWSTLFLCLVCPTPALTTCLAFSVTTPHAVVHLSSPTQLRAKLSSHQDADRRAFILGVSSTFLLPISAAHATYSAFAHREQDWQERKTRGEIQFSTARQLRSQLRDLVPQNDDSSSKIFCPNGPTSNVSPLMENKCSDQLAMPSVYGRRDDNVGNSIPGRVAR